jgi:hypothetical protein
VQDTAVENRLRERVRMKAATYGQEPGDPRPVCKVPPAAIGELFARWIIPLTCDVEVADLLERRDP